ncbi:MAG: flagellar biosynthesis anti-sigma factor FlgM [Actinomycetota bacterium]
MRMHGSEMWERPRFSVAWSGGSGSIPSVDPKINRMILEQLKGMPDVRSELVVYLRRAIEENRYYVPEELVAERMICCLAAVN